MKTLSPEKVIIEHLVNTVKPVAYKIFIKAFIKL